MRIQNAKIVDVRVGFDDRDNLSARMKFKSLHSCCEWGFILSNTADVKRLCALMKYTNAYEIKELEGKIIREVDSENFFRGFGHPIEDKFVLINDGEFVEMTQENVESIVKN